MAASGGRATPRTYGGRTTEERRSARRARLVDAVVAELAEPGPSVTMTAVCARAGLTERYFYESFPSLDQAMLAALDEVADEILTLTIRAAAAATGPAPDRVRAVVTAFLDHADAAPDRVRMVVVGAWTRPRLRARRAELVEAFGASFATETAAIYGDDAWPTRRARAHGTALVAALSELFAARLGGTSTLDREELLETATRLFAVLGSRGAG